MTLQDDATELARSVEHLARTLATLGERYLAPVTRWLNRQPAVQWLDRVTRR